jgi:uncharacterized protein YcfL
MKKLLLFLTVLMMVGCGARKVNKSQIEVKQETTSTIKDTSSQVSEKNETLQDTTSIIEECFEPIDSTKEMVVNGKVFKNVRFKTTKIKKGITIAKKEDNVLNQSKTTNNNTTTEIKEDTKDTYKESTFNLWWLLLLLGAGLFYYEYKKQ